MVIFSSRTIFVLVLACPLVSTFGQESTRQWESIDRGLVAIKKDTRTVCVSWRLLRTDSKSIEFNCYRKTVSGRAIRLNDRPIRSTTFFVDKYADATRSTTYFVRPVHDGKEEADSRPFKVNPVTPPKPYLSLPLRTPEGYRPNDASVGDLDGDGRYDIVLHQVGRSRDNSQRGTTTEPILEAYTFDGKMLWRINLGKNIREGAHYTQFMVFDLDGDGRAEVACKTADGTIDGKGKVIGDAAADYRNDEGYVLDGPEFLTIFDGRTGAALATTNYLPARQILIQLGRAWKFSKQMETDKVMPVFNCETPCKVHGVTMA